MRLTLETYAEQRAKGVEPSVTLNGEPLAACIEADDEAGYAICLKHEKRGSVLVFEADENKRRIEERFEGVVKITLMSILGYEVDANA